MTKISGYAEKDLLHRNCGCQSFLQGKYQSTFSIYKIAIFELNNVNNNSISWKYKEHMICIFLAYWDKIIWMIDWLVLGARALSGDEISGP